ncbi:MAG: aminopeptidase P family protein [Chitinispirillia bacterium]|jgi:Xaa-Pro aminopeptidase
MYEYRLAEVKKLLKEKCLTYLLISDPVSVRYISGFISSNVYMLLTSKSNILFTDFRYKDVAQKFCKVTKKWKFIQIKGSGLSFLGKYFRSGSNIGIQSDKLTVDQLDSLKKAVKKCKIKKIGNSLSEIFCIKSRKEINSIKKAASIADKAYGEILRSIKPGMTEKSIANQLDLLKFQYGSEKSAFDTIVLFGSRTALVHGIPSNRKLKNGNFILFDFGCVVDGFCSDMTRTIIFGKANKLQKKIYDIVKKAQESAKKSIRQGLKISSIDDNARSLITEAGYGDSFGHSTGHGIGLQVHEFPYIYNTCKAYIAENMVFTVEPGIYLSGFGGVRIEDTICVTKNGLRSLTQSPRELQII